VGIVGESGSRLVETGSTQSANEGMVLDLEAISAEWEPPRQLAAGGHSLSMRCTFTTMKVNGTWTFRFGCCGVYTYRTHKVDATHRANGTYSGTGWYVQ
jgi:hypothetical protein